MGSSPSKGKYAVTACGGGDKVSTRTPETKINDSKPLGLFGRIRRKPKSESDIRDQSRVKNIESDVGQSASTLTLKSSYNIEGEGNRQSGEEAKSNNEPSDYKKTSQRSPTPYPPEEEYADCDKDANKSKNVDKTFRDTFTKPEESVLDELKSQGIIKVNNIDLFNKKKEEMARNILAELRQIGLTEDGKEKANQVPHLPPRLAPINKDDIRRKMFNKELYEADDLLDDIDTELEKSDGDYLSLSKEKFLTAGDKLARIPEETGTGKSPRSAASTPAGKATTRTPITLSQPRKFVPAKPGRVGSRSKYPTLK